jgi:hypothetical protein
MTDQVVIDFPEVTHEQYRMLLSIKDKITVKLWKSDERKTIPLKWNGTRLCCPISIYFDFPEGLLLFKEKDD